MTNSDLDAVDTDTLLKEIRQRVSTAQKEASMVVQSASFSPIDQLGQRVRTECKKQGLTLNGLCELSGVAYATLSKIEQGHPSARLDSLVGVVRALGMKLWVG